MQQERRVRSLTCKEPKLAAARCCHFIEKMMCYYSVDRKIANPRAVCNSVKAGSHYQAPSYNRQTVTGLKTATNEFTLTSPSDRELAHNNLACAILIRRKTLSHGEIKVCLFQWQLYVCVTVVRQCPRVHRGLFFMVTVAKGQVSTNVIIIIYPLTARVIGVPRMISQPVSVWLGCLFLSYGESRARYNLTEPVPPRVEHVAVEFIVEPFRPSDPCLRTTKISAKSKYKRNKISQ